MPRVSVIIPTLNCSRYLERAIRSALQQTYRDFEIVVADDGSSDDTARLVARFPTVRYFYQINRGLPAARNLAVSRSNGELIAYLDADDMWYPHKLQEQVSFLDAHPECGLVHSDLHFINEDDQLIVPQWYQPRRAWRQQGPCLTELLHECLIQVPTVVERRSCFDETSGFDERFRRVEDYLHWVQIALKGRHFGYNDQPLAMYRCQADSLSRNQAAMTEATLMMFQVLIDECGLLTKTEPAVEEIVKARIQCLKQALPGHLRRMGRTRQAREQAWKLIKASPEKMGPYLEYLKACFPTKLVKAAGTFRARFT